MKTSLVEPSCSASPTLYPVVELVEEVKVRTAISSLFSAHQGVPQGSPLSPLLYNIFCFDIDNHDPTIFNPNRYILQFADDTALITHENKLELATQSLQILLDNTLSWCSKWRVLVNPLKTQFLIPFHKISPLSPTLNIDHTSQGFKIFGHHI